MLKPKTETLQKGGFVYGYDCFCDAKYVGETKRKLETRIQEHNRKSKLTSVYDHIKTFPQFAKHYVKIHGKSTTFLNSRIESKNRVNILKDRFTIIGSNLGNYFRRTDYEGIYITLNKPVLNEQVKHRNVQLI